MLWICLFLVALSFIASCVCFVIIYKMKKDIEKLMNHSHRTVRFESKPWDGIEDKDG